MKKFMVILICILFGAAAIAWAVDEAKGQKEYSWRYKMTVEIDTPEGIKTGSAVREVKILFTPNKDAKSGYNSAIDLRGEAVVVDLGRRGVVFALLTGPLRGQSYGQSIPFEVFKGPSGRTLAGAEFYSKLSAIHNLEEKYYPLFVTFDDLNDPKTVRPLLEFYSDGSYPLKYAIKKNEFEKFLGKGVNIRSVKLEMTKEPITNKIKKYMPSYADENAFWDWYKTLDYNDPRRIGPSEFVRN